MRLVIPEQTRPGMVLAAPVTDRRGRLLISAETSLTERHVQALCMWGVPHIEIEGDEPLDDPQPAADPEAVAAIEQDVDARFRNVALDHPFVAGLRQYALTRAVADLAGRGRQA